MRRHVNYKTETKVSQPEEEKRFAEYATVYLVH
jgi:hypothetical protein